MDKDSEDFGDVSNFPPPQHLKKLLADIKAGRAPKPDIMTIIALSGYTDLEDGFEELEINDPEMQHILRTFTSLCATVDFDTVRKVRKVPVGFPYIVGFDLDDSQGLLFLKEAQLVKYIDFDW